MNALLGHVQLMGLAEVAGDFLRGCNVPLVTAPSFYDEMVQRQKGTTAIAPTPRRVEEVVKPSDIDALASVEAELDAAVRVRRRVVAGKKARAKGKRKAHSRGKQRQQGMESNEDSHESDDGAACTPQRSQPATPPKPGVSIKDPAETKAPSAAAPKEEPGSKAGGKGVSNTVAALAEAARQHTSLISGLGRTLSNQFSNLLSSRSRGVSLPESGGSAEVEEGEESESSSSSPRSLMLEDSDLLAHQRRELSSDQVGSRFASDFVKLECIGKGGFGRVWRVRNRLDGMDYAIKSVNAASRTSFPPSRAPT